MPPQFLQKKEKGRNGEYMRDKVGLEEMRRRDMKTGMCGGLNESGPHKLTCFNACWSVGKPLWDGLEGVA